MKTSVVVAAGLSLFFFTSANALAETSLDVCDALGLSGLTIDSDTNTLQIRGGVQYEYALGDEDDAPPLRGPRAAGAGAGEECGRNIWLNDQLMFSNIRLSLNPGFIISAPGGFGLLEHNTGGGFTTPGYEVPVTYQGFKANFGIEAQVNYSGFTPFDFGTNLEFGQINGKGTTGSVTITGSPGIPGGPGGGSLTNNPVLSTTIDTSRTFGGFGMEARIPFRGEVGSHGDINYAYTTYFIVGDRIGAISETQKIRIVTSSDSVAYDTAYGGGYFGLYGGVGLDKTIKLPNNDMYFGVNANLTAGFDAHAYQLTDDVDISGATSSTTNSGVSFIPTAKLGGGVYLGSDTLFFGIDTGISTGLYPAINVDRGLSAAPKDPTAILTNFFNYELSASIKGRY